MVFCFGSNLAGRHGAGAALYARQHHGAIYGQGEGRQGNSYGIPTKNIYIKTLPLTEIKKYVDRFLEYASIHSELEFKVTAIGTGLAGYKHEEIAQMFAQATKNCFLPVEWEEWCPKCSFWFQEKRP